MLKMMVVIWIICAHLKLNIYSFLNGPNNFKFIKITPINNPNDINYPGEYNHVKEFGFLRLYFIYIFFFFIFFIILIMKILNYYYIDIPHQISKSKEWKIVIWFCITRDT